MGRKDRQKARQHDKAKAIAAASPAELLVAARRKLEAGSAREAIELLKQARRGPSPPPEVELALLCAWSVRAGQLEAAGMAKEAAEVRGLAAGVQRGLGTAILSWDAIAPAARQLALGDLVRLFVACGSPAAAEPLVTDRLVIEGDFDQLGSLPAEHPLRRDAPVAATARAAMELGDWGAADVALKPLDRGSPYTRWRVFAKAMVAHQADDRAAVGRALERLPDDFTLTAARARLLRFAIDGATVAHVPDDGVASLGRELLAGVRDGRAARVEEILPALAARIAPERPLAALDSLLQIVASAALHARELTFPVFQLVDRLLPAADRPRLRARLGLISRVYGHEQFDVGPARDYLAHLDEEFVDPRQGVIARGLVFEHLARGWRAADPCPHCVGRQGMRAVADLLGGVFIDDVDEVASAFAAVGLGVDPGNRALWRIRTEELRRLGDDDGLVDLLLEQAKQQPDDPQPLLDLARLHYRKNAHRKAEAVLEKAHQRAPHDESIRELRCIGHLISSDRNRASGRVAQSRKDLLAAEFGAPKRLASLLRIKHLAVELAGSVDGGVERLVERLAKLPLLQRLRSLLLLIHDFVRHGRAQPTVNALGKALARMAPLVAELSPTERLELLAPLDPQHASLFRDVNVAASGETLWLAAMDGMEGDSLYRLFDIVLAAGGAGGGGGVVRRLINVRIAGKKRRDCDSVMLLYRETIDFMRAAGEDPAPLRRVVESSSAAERGRLIEAGRRLAAYAADDAALSLALRTLDFASLDDHYLHGDHGGHHHHGPHDRDGAPHRPGLLGESAATAAPTEWDDGQLFARGGLEIPYSPPEAIIADAEAMLDEVGLRGARSAAIREFAADQRARPEMRREVDQFARLLAPFREHLSPELDTLLFARRKR